MNTNDKYDKYDKNNDRSNRSLLMMAGQRSLNQNVSIINAQKIQPNKSELISKNTIQKQKQNSTRKLMMKLTLPRLRKMQALARGFLVRRKVYPPKLQQYLLAKSILNLMISNVVYRESSQIILQNITYIKYSPKIEQQIVGVQKIIQNQICNGIIQRVFKKQLNAIVQVSTAQYAKLITRPKITYGFNLRDPLELLLFDMINNFVGMNYKQIIRQAIQECVDQNRQLRVIDQWIIKYNMLNGLFQEIVNQALNQSIGEYIVENMLNRICMEGAEVVARVCFDEEIQERKQKSFGQIQKKMIQWILQEGSLKSIISLGHSISK